MNYTQSLGNIVELKCITKFIELGYECSIPYGNGAKYDFIADINGELLRFQCKSASHPKRDGIEDKDAIQISTVCQTTNTQKTVRHTYSEEQIDYFATCYEDKIYIIPVEECSTSKTLRLKPPKNEQVAYNKAEDYEISVFFTESKDLVNSKKVFQERTQQKTQQEFFCSQCGKSITCYSDTGLCLECYQKSARRVVRPTREELKKMIRTLPFTTIGKKFGVSDNAIRQWCRAENLPSRVNDIKTYSDEKWEKI